MDKIALYSLFPVTAKSITLNIAYHAYYVPVNLAQSEIHIPVILCMIFIEVIIIFIVRLHKQLIVMHAITFALYFTM